MIVEVPFVPAGQAAYQCLGHVVVLRLDASWLVSPFLPFCLLRFFDGVVLFLPLEVKKAEEI